ncbi:NAD(P)-dependent oxidoreductase [Haloactinopolyspora sp.]|uniref:NAD-dependent epimerase/dehydratase family protein n=1 Tax=Haloactinopolyspora sp. TaxID=1966353 RepID=UPI0026266B6A|nr:NAD(P)-dependent oxidoreductase [Haloactinopolyspora sp.]
MAQRKVLVTGASGRVAEMLRAGLDGVHIRAVDRGDLPADAGHETAVGDLANRPFAEEVVDGVDVVVHLAANPAPYASWDDLRAPNVEALVNIVDAANRAGVRRVVLASSVHAMGGYVRPGVVVEPDWPVRPCCRYGATKAFSEAYGRMTALTTDMSVICLRLGACLPRPVDSGSAPGWLAPEDLQQLVRRCLEADVRTGTYFGVSANTRTAFDIANARAELGYEPRHDSEAYAADLPEGDGGLCRITPLET